MTWLAESPFAQLADELPADSFATRANHLGSAKRGFCPIRKTFVQRPRAAGVDARASVLGAMVNAREEVALRQILLVHALEPVLGYPLHLAVWARMLASPRRPCSSAQVARGFEKLAARHLVSVERTGHRVAVAPLLEDGSGQAFERATRKGADVGPGYFTIPNAFWTDGLVDQLRLPGLAMFLVALAETSAVPYYRVSLEQMAPWYGISERTAERGYNELARAGVLLTHLQTIASPKSPTGSAVVMWRALADPYSSDARRRLQTSTRTAAAAASGGRG